LRDKGGKVKNRVLAVGSIAIDDVKTPFGRKKSIGGSAIYFSIACSFFSPVSIVGIIGKDFPEKFLKKLKKRGIDINGVEKTDGKTFFWKGKYDFDLNTAITLKTELNVFSKFKPQLLKYQKNIPYIFLANIDPRLQMYVTNSMYKPRIIALDTMNYWIENRRKELLKLLKGIDYFLINDGEARELGGDANLIKASKRILSFGPKLLIVKHGEYGSSMFYKNKNRIDIFSSPSIPLEKVVDPTGAGDSFAGGFMGYIASKGKEDFHTLKNAIAFGTVIASFTVEGFGVSKLLSVKFSEIKKRYNHLHKISCFKKI